MKLRGTRTRGAILVVDDEVEFHELIRAIFSTTHDVRGVKNVEDAVRVLRQTHIDVILLDVRLPRRPGWDLLRALSKNPKSPPVIVITADARSQVRQEAEELGAVFTLFKPVKPRQLRKMIDGLATP